MSRIWSDTCEIPTAVDWVTQLVAVKINGWVVFREVPDRGEGFVAGINDFLVFTGTSRSRRRVKKNESDFLLLGA